MTLELLRNRRSVRKYKDVPVEQEKIDALVKAALLSPSSRSLRPWEFIVVTDKSILNKLSECKPHGAAFLKDAPLGIVVTADPAKCDVWVEDTSIASIIIQLAAETMGLGSCWIQIRKRMHSDTQTAEDYIKGVIKIPESYTVESIIAIGYPDERKTPYSEKDLLYQKVHLNEFHATYRCTGSNSH